MHQIAKTVIFICCIVQGNEFGIICLRIDLLILSGKAHQSLDANTMDPISLQQAVVPVQIQEGLLSSTKVACFSLEYTLPSQK